MKIVAPLLAALLLGACSEVAPAEQSMRVPMMRRGGDTFTVQVAIAGVCCAPFLLDSGATDVSVPPRLFRAMVKDGLVRQADVIDVATYATAAGTVEGLRFRMPPLTLGGITLHGVVGSVTPDAPDGMLLLGQSFLRRFRSWSIDNQTNELVLR